eukprot:TRINITY_DN4025_c3_g1_i2.p1 TRINITY_DN4025_c3_g1~~TRINITY_DN4025_c3_g1_i2.p1  ORF type:complete len:334 (+),score=42.19 TRINITY_DN4025_c3_g1_i2:111-1112(+)
MHPKRRKLTASQRLILEKSFLVTCFPSSEERLRLARDTGLVPRSVQIWFQNTRQKQQLTKKRVPRPTNNSNNNSNNKSNNNSLCNNYKTNNNINKHNLNNNQSLVPLRTTTVSIAGKTTANESTKHVAPANTSASYLAQTPSIANGIHAPPTTTSTFSVAVPISVSVPVSVPVPVPRGHSSSQQYQQSLQPLEVAPVGPASYPQQQTPWRTTSFPPSPVPAATRRSGHYGPPIKAHSQPSSLQREVPIRLSNSMPSSLPSSTPFGRRYYNTASDLPELSRRSLTVPLVKDLVRLPRDFDCEPTKSMLDQDKDMDDDDSNEGRRDRVTLTDLVN